MKYNLINNLKKYSWILISAPFLINFINNLIQGKIIIFNYYFENKFLIFIFVLNLSFYLILSKYINNSLELESLSLSLCYFLSSYFLFDYLTLFLLKNVLFTHSFYIVSVFWYVLIFFKNKSIKQHIFITVVYISVLLINNRFFDYVSNLKKYIQLNTDVPVQWFPMAQNIHSKNYFFSFTNNLIDGHGLYLSHLQSTVFKINFPLQEFQFVRLNSNIFLFFFLLLIIDSTKGIKSKISVSILYLSIVLNSDWITYLFIDSLMLEGIVSFIFAVFIFNLEKFSNLKELNLKSILFFTMFGLLIFSKQFISLLTIFVFIFVLLFKKNLNAFVLLPLYALNRIYVAKFTPEINNFEYFDGTSPFRIFLDFIFLRNLEFTNILKIINQFLIDKPTSLLIILFLGINLYLIYKNKTTFMSTFLLSLFLVNLFLVFILFITYWKDFGIQSSYRYIMNTFHIILLSIAICLDLFEKDIES